VCLSIRLVVVVVVVVDLTDCYFLCLRGIVKSSESSEHNDVTKMEVEDGSDDSGFSNWKF
jgi:hypothetical protein